RNVRCARPGQRITHLDAAAGAAGCKIALSLQRAKAVGVRVFMLPQRKDSRRRFEQDSPPAIAAGEAAGDQPAMADKIAGGPAGGIIDKITRPGAAGIEAQVRGYPPAQIGAGGPAVALEHAVKRLRAIVEMLVPAEHADQKIRRELAREPGDGVDLRTLKITAECVAVEIATTHANPADPAPRPSAGHP